MWAAFLASRAAIWAAIYPEGGCDAEERRVLEEEAREGNARVVIWLSYGLVPLCLATLVVVLGEPESDPTRVAWQRGVVRIVATFAVLGIAPALVVRRGRPEALWHSLGDVLGSVYVLCASAMSANAQRAHPNINVFLITVIGVAFLLRMTPWVFALALAAGGGLVAAGIERFQPNVVARHVNELSVIGVSSLALLASLLTRSMRLGVFLARRQVERLNGELERRVEAQVGEILRRAREIDQLNDQLNQKIKERSRELSMALARLADGYQGLAVGAVLGGRVTIEAWIGAGGMGVVYRGRDRVTDRTVAVKVIQAGSAGELDGLYRFLREAQAMATVTHRAIVRSIHVDVSEDGLLFQMMELVEGESLESRLDRAGPLPPRVAARLGAVLAGGLAAAHAAGVVHRDVKPSNVMLTPAAPGLKLLDFGISKVWNASETSGTTAQLPRDTAVRLARAGERPRERRRAHRRLFAGAPPLSVHRGPHALQGRQRAQLAPRPPRGRPPGARDVRARRRSDAGSLGDGVPAQGSRRPPHRRGSGGHAVQGRRRGGDALALSAPSRRDRGPGIARPRVAHHGVQDHGRDAWGHRDRIGPGKKKPSGPDSSLIFVRGALFRCLTRPVRLGTSGAP